VAVIGAVILTTPGDDGGRGQVASTVADDRHLLITLGVQHDVREAAARGSIGDCYCTSFVSKSIGSICCGFVVQQAAQQIEPVEFQP